MFTVIKLTIKYLLIGFPCMIGLFSLGMLLTALGIFDASPSESPSDLGTVSPDDAAATPLEVEPIVIQYQYDTVADPMPEPDSNYEINYAGADGHIIKIQHNPGAVDPTYDQVINFLKSDTTDQVPYDDNRFVCGDYAEQVQHNAENAGYNCGWVVIEFANKAGGHACNAFNTVDKGVIFVDCTGFDSVVDLENGQEYHPVTLSKLLGYSNVETDPMGIVKSYSVKW